MSADWRQSLRSDPANWLLDSDENPSIAFWFMRDIVGRPENAAAMLKLREKILFSQPVQDIFAAQNELGYWHNPDRLDEPKHRSTLWTLALLTELGIPRNSRRARAACEYALENLNLSDHSLLGLLARSLLYFNYHHDSRLTSILDSIVSDAEPINVYALWTLADAADEKYAAMLNKSAEYLLNCLARGKFKIFGAFPSFDADDALLALRILAQLNRLGDDRARETIEQVWARQGEGARWALGKSHAGSTVVQLKIAPEPNKWATLNVLRIVTKT